MSDEVERFIRQAEDLNQRMAVGAVIGWETSLAPEFWTRDSVGLLLVQYCHELDRCLLVMFGNPGARPEMLDVLAGLEFNDTRDLREENYARITNVINYVLARLLVTRLSQREAPAGVRARATEVFDALWSLPGAQELSTRVRWLAAQALVALAVGRRQDVPGLVAQVTDLDLAKVEGADRTLLKTCGLLARLEGGEARKVSTSAQRRSASARSGGDGSTLLKRSKR